MKGPRTVPLFVFYAGYDPVKSQQGLEGCSAQTLVRLRAGRCFHADPSFAGPPARTGQPRRHGSNVWLQGSEHLAGAFRRVCLKGSGAKLRILVPIMSAHPPAEGVREAHATVACVSTPVRATIWRFFNRLTSSGGVFVLPVLVSLSFG